MYHWLIAVDGWTGRNADIKDGVLSQDESRRAYRWFYHEDSVIVSMRIFTMVERFMNYLKEKMDGEAMINCIKNHDQPLPHVTQVSIGGTSSTEQPSLKDKSMWKRIRLKRDKSEQNKIKTGQKREAWRSPEKLRAVSVDRARKTKENA
nr:hypothetical protein [Tanacetum cinerariifolium]